MEMGGGICRFRNHSVAGTVRWPITLTLLAQFTYPVGLSWCLRFLNLLLSEQVEMVTMVILGM